MSESSEKEPQPKERYLKKMIGIIRSKTHRERINALFFRIKARLPELEALSRKLDVVEENGVYRFYHGSYKVFDMQEPIKEAFALIKEIGAQDDPPILRTLNLWRPEPRISFGVIGPMQIGKRRLSRF